MFKVIIIDDEPIIRKGIKNIINWKQFDCVICAEASDGEEGKMVIHKHLPDIIITDIHMPDTDGLKMIRDIKNIVPNCKIIILTGYRDFDYVQEAIKLGVFDFVLKPSKIEELTAVVSKAILELNSMKSRAEELEKLKRLFEQNIPILKEKLLYDIIYEIYPSKADILSRAGLLGVCINRFVLLAVEIDNEDDNEKLSQYDSHLYQFGIVNTFMEVFSDSFEVLSIPLNGKGAAFILQPTAKVTGYMELVNQKCDYVQEMITNCFGFTVTIAVSSEGTGIMQLAEKFSECREALERKFYLGSNTTIFQDDLNTFIKFDDYSVLEKYQKHLLDSIKTGNKRLVAERLEDIFSYINGLERVNMEYLKSFFLLTISTINNIRLSVAQFQDDRNVEGLHIPSTHKLIEDSDNIPELNELLKEVSFSITSKINNYNNKSLTLILRKAIDYLHKHYHEQVTLNEVAEHVYVSTSYISRMFKKELGRNFVDYLNGIRLEKAKELLKDPKYKTYEVAEMVGIQDAHYFSRLFKKYQGLTPTEYRES
jgi:two-component system response regulator YesN